MEYLKATNKDLRDCLTLYNEYVKNTNISFELEEVKKEEYQKRFDIFLQNPFYVARDNGELVGFAYLTEFNFRAGYSITKDLTIYLKKDCTHQGVGTSLYTLIEKEAKVLGTKNIVSLVTKGNDISEKFHEKLGFTKCGELENVAFKFNEFQTLEYYIKHI